MSDAEDRSAADLNAEDTEDRWWSLLRDAVELARDLAGAAAFDDDSGDDQTGE